MQGDCFLPSSLSFLPTQSGNQWFITQDMSLVVLQVFTCSLSLSLTVPKIITNVHTNREAIKSKMSQKVEKVLKGGGITSENKKDSTIQNLDFLYERKGQIFQVFPQFKWLRYDIWWRYWWDIGSTWYIYDWCMIEIVQMCQIWFR